MTKRDEKTAFPIEKQIGILLHCNNIPIYMMQYFCAKVKGYLQKYATNCHMTDIGYRFTRNYVIILFISLNHIHKFFVKIVQVGPK